jgi:hypothetical protein
MNNDMLICSRSTETFIIDEYIEDKQIDGKIRDRCTASGCKRQDVDIFKMDQ